VKQPDKPHELEKEEPKAWLRRTSEKILAIGAGLEAFLRFTDKIVFSKEPCYEPDKEFIAELVALMRPASQSREDC
jgi:hypothetical protein